MATECQRARGVSAVLCRTGARMARMAAAWAVIGLVAGFENGRAENAGMAGYLAHLIASPLVFSVLGLLLGVVSVRWREACIGAATGYLVAWLGTLSGSENPFLLRCVGLNIGGLVGVTSWPVIQLVVSGLYFTNWLFRQAVR